MSVVISNKYQVVVPKKVRVQAGLKPGQTVQVSYHGGKIILDVLPSINDIIIKNTGIIKTKDTAWGKAGIDAAEWIRKMRDEEWG
jgi:AbrB family looped-hinge helix DNA binding protein